MVLENALLNTTTRVAFDNTWDQQWWLPIVALTIGSAMSLTVTYHAHRMQYTGVSSTQTSFFRTARATVASVVVACLAVLVMYMRIADILLAWQLEMILSNIQLLAALFVSMMCVGFYLKVDAAAAD